VKNAAANAVSSGEKKAKGGKEKKEEEAFVNTTPKGEKKGASDVIS
jgi:valyl-tRNA synthetase